MKLRYGDASTRASNDLDAARCTSVDEFKDELYEAQRVPGVLPTADEAVAWANALVRSIEEATEVPSR